MQERWLSLLHHVANEHQCITQQCDHATEIGPPRDGHGNVLQYFDKRESAFKALQKLACDCMWKVIGVLHKISVKFVVKSAGISSLCSGSNVY